MRPSTRSAALGLGALAAAALWWRRHPSACPYSQRFWVEAPHPFITRDRLGEALGDVHGRRVLEIGPGTGYYTLPVAGWIGPDGRLDAFDVQQEMLDHTLRRAADQGIANLHAARGDARSLPYPDATFDAAFLVAVLGEIPDQTQRCASCAACSSPAGASWSASCGATRTWCPPGGCAAAPSRRGWAGSTAWAHQWASLPSCDPGIDRPCATLTAVLRAPVVDRRAPNAC